MELSRDVYYRKYGKQVYLRHTAARRDLLLNGSAFEALECLAALGPCSEEELLDHMVARHIGTREQCARFLTQLAEEGILADGAAPEADDSSILESVMDACARSHQLFSVSLELTYRCNERCVHCYVDDAGDCAKEELNLDEYKKLLDELWAMGCMSILLTGGEVFLKKDFLEIAAYAVSAGMLVDIYTNGSLMTDEQFDALRGMHLNSLSFSLYGGTAAVHDRVTGVPGSFERTVRSAMMTKCAGIDTFIKTVVMRENVEDWENLLKLGRRLNIEVNPSYEIIDTHAGRSAEIYRLQGVEAYRKAIELQRRCQPQSRSAQTGGRRDPLGPICNAGGCSLSINPYGDVTPCLSLPILLGNIREHSVRDIWDRSPALEWLKGVTYQDICPDCGGCGYFNHCGMCLGATNIAPGRKAVRPDYPCLIAEAKFLQMPASQ